MEKARKQFLVQSFDLTDERMPEQLEYWLNETEDYSPEMSVQGGKFIFVIMRAVHRIPNPKPEPKPAPAEKKKPGKKKK